VALDVAACNRPLDRQAVLAVLEQHGAAALADRFLGGFAQLGRAAWRRAPASG
jgi:hypothetical protein